MILFLLSLLAGALTVLAPCVLPLLPVVIAGTAEDSRSLALRLIELTTSPATLSVDGAKVTARKVSGEVEVRDSTDKVIPGFYTMWFAWAIYHQKDGVVWTTANQL